MSKYRVIQLRAETNGMPAFEVQKLTLGVLWFCWEYVYRFETAEAAIAHAKQLKQHDIDQDNYPQTIFRT